MKKFYRPSHAELILWLRTHKISGGADTAALNKAVDDVTSATAAVEGAKDSVITFINGSAAATAKAVTDALTADNAADDASIAVAVGAINTVRDRQLAAAQAITEALATTPPA